MSIVKVDVLLENCRKPIHAWIFIFQNISRQSVGLIIRSKKKSQHHRTSFPISKIYITWYIVLTPWQNKCHKKCNSLGIFSVFTFIFSKIWQKIAKCNNENFGVRISSTFSVVRPLYFELFTSNALLRHFYKSGFPIGRESLVEVKFCQKGSKVAGSKYRKGRTAPNPNFEHSIEINFEPKQPNWWHDVACSQLRVDTYMIGIWFCIWFCGW